SPERKEYHPPDGAFFSRCRLWWAFENSDFAARSENTSSNRGSRDSEAVVGVFEFCRNTRTRRSAGNLYVVPPGATSRGSAASVGRPLRVSFGRVTVVAS